MTKQQAIGLLAGFAIACSTASSVQGPSQSDFDNLKAQVDALSATVTGQAGAISGLQGQVTALGADLDAAEATVAALDATVSTLEGAATGGQVFVQATGTGSAKSSRLTFQAAVNATPIGTYIGSNASRTVQASVLNISSTTGYYAEVEADGTPAARFFGNILWELPGCTGKAWMRESFGETFGVTAYGARQGLVVRVTTDRSIPSGYLMLVKGTPREQVSYASRMTSTGTCLEEPAGSLVGYALVANDEAVSGVASGPIGASPQIGR